MSSSLFDPRATTLAPAPAAGPAAAPKGQWLTYGDPIRLLGVVCVVIGHVADMQMFRLPPTTAQWWVCDVVNALCRWAVPLYIMLSGAILLAPERNRPIGQWYRHRLTHLGVPLLFWSIFYTFFGLYYTGWVASPHDAWLNLLRGSPYPHIYFFVVIFGLSAFTPMLRIFVRNASRGMLVGTTIALLAVACGNSIADAILRAQPNAFARFVPFLGFYLLGYVLRDTRLTRRGLAWCFVGAVVSVLLLASATGFFTHIEFAAYLAAHGGSAAGWSLPAYPSISMMAFDFLSPIRILYSTCVWLIFVNVCTKPWPDRGWHRFAVRQLSPATLGIVLVHPMFRELLHKGTGWHGEVSAATVGRWLTTQVPATPEWAAMAVGIAIVSALVYLPSAAFVLTLRQVPVVKRIVG
jgi:surface polysaccharide O-acyltransferase-like enzyme